MDWKKFISSDVIKLVEEVVESSVSLDPFLPHPYPLHENFTGRKEEREILTNWYKHNPPMFALVAHGGMGKSSLAWYWLKEEALKQGKTLRGVIWWSFYDNDAGFESFLNQSLRYVSQGEIDPRVIPSVHDRMVCLSHILASQRFLLVLDGVERMLAAYAGLSSVYNGDDIKEDRKGEFRSCIDPNFAVFLKKMANELTQTKTLLTSTLFPRELDRKSGCNRYYLRRFSLEDAMAYLNAEEMAGDRDDIKPIAAPLGYHPLSLRLFVGLCRERRKHESTVECAQKIDLIKNRRASDMEVDEKVSRLLTHIYNRLPVEEQTLLSQLSASRKPLKYEAIHVLQPEWSEKKIKKLLKKLELKGLIYLLDHPKRYDMHPFVRKYAYQRLAYKAGTHACLRDYYAEIPKPAKLEFQADLNPTIELYHHTIKSGRYDNAATIFNDRLAPLYFLFSAYRRCIELLSALFPDGEDGAYRLSNEDTQGWALNALALSCSNCGQAARAVPLMEKANQVYENMGNKKRVALILGNLAQDQMAMGSLEDAEDNLKRKLEICRQINDEVLAAVAHQGLGRLRAYQGEFEQAEQELVKSSEICVKTNNLEGMCLDEAYRALTAFKRQDYTGALEIALKARELAAVEQFESDIIYAEWLLGAACRANDKLTKAENHLREALSHCRRINLVEIEADILLELAKVQRENVVNLAKSKGRKLFDEIRPHLPESPEVVEAHADVSILAAEALEIANRCQYRLQQADIHLFLAQLALDRGDRYKARREVEAAYKRASCGYRPTMNAAKQLMETI